MKSIIHQREQLAHGARKVISLQRLATAIEKQKKLTDKQASEAFCCFSGALTALAQSRAVVSAISLDRIVGAYETAIEYATPKQSAASLPPSYVPAVSPRSLNGTGGGPVIVSPPPPPTANSELKAVAIISAHENTSPTIRD
jgi:hypothetical protein